MAEKPIFRTAEEAWAEFNREVAPIPYDQDVMLAVFMAGMSSALSIGYHYGFAELRAEIDRVSRDG